MFSESVDESMFVLTKIPRSELHLLLGPVNKMLDELCKVWPDYEEKWMKG